MTTNINDLKGATPLSVPRESLIEILQEKLDETAALRDEGLEDAKKADAPVLEAIALFTPDELLSIFRSYFTVKVPDLLAHKREQTFVPEEEKVPADEERMQNVINLLHASTDAVIELDSSSELYSAAVQATKSNRLRF